jgi:hypothetical protein
VRSARARAFINNRKREIVRVVLAVIHGSASTPSRCKTFPRFLARKPRQRGTFNNNNNKQGRSAAAAVANNDPHGQLRAICLFLLSFFFPPSSSIASFEFGETLRRAEISVAMIK